jgi:hypothetical protein
LLPAADLVEDVGSRGGPDERFGVVIVLGKIGVDGDFQVSDSVVQGSGR